MLCPKRGTADDGYPGGSTQPTVSICPAGLRLFGLRNGVRYSTVSNVWFKKFDN